MAGDDADILDRRLAEAGRAWNTKTAVDDLWQRRGPKAFDDPIDIAAIGGPNDTVVNLPATEPGGPYVYVVQLGGYDVDTNPETRVEIWSK